MVVTALRQRRIANLVCEKKKPPGKTGRLFVLSKIELGCVLADPNQRATSAMFALERIAYSSQTSRYVREAPIDDIAGLA
jgi:hypothetical protein